MKVEWVEDLRPMPDNCPPGCENAAFDPSLIIKKRGEIIATQRNIWGNWYSLIVEDNGKITEVKSDKLRKLE